MFCWKCHKELEEGQGHYVGSIVSTKTYYCDECKLKKDTEPRVKIPIIRHNYTSSQPHIMINCGKRGIEYTCKKLEESGALYNKPQLQKYCDIKMKAAKKMEYSTIDLQRGHNESD